jgi:hypothetical protein
MIKNEVQNSLYRFAFASLRLCVRFMLAKEETHAKAQRRKERSERGFETHAEKASEKLS